MNTLYAILLLLAVVSFVLAAYFTRPGRPSAADPLMFMAIGLALFAAPFMIQQFDRL